MRRSARSRTRGGCRGGTTTRKDPTSCSSRRRAAGRWRPSGRSPAAVVRGRAAGAPAVGRGSVGRGRRASSGGCSRATLFRWRDRCERDGLAGLLDRPRPAITAIWHPTLEQAILLVRMLSYWNSRRHRGRVRAARHRGQPRPGRPPLRAGGHQPHERCRGCPVRATSGARPTSSGTSISRVRSTCPSPTARPADLPLRRPGRRLQPLPARHPGRARRRRPCRSSRHWPRRSSCAASRTSS